MKIVTFNFMHLMRIAIRNNSQIPFSNPPLQLQLEQIKSAAN